MKRKTAYLGPKGTFTQEAAAYLLPADDYEFVPYKTIPDVLSATYSGAADLAVVPVENSLEGSVNLTLDWLVHHVTLPIKGELVYPISQHLLVHPACEHLALADYTKVLSHPQAIAQCQQFLWENLPQAEIEYANSTSEAARLVSEHPEQQWLAIGTQLANDLYGLRFRDQSIQDNGHNYTRFIVVGSTPVGVTEQSTGEKTSLLVTLPEDFPGALHQVLAVFSWRKINMTRIESRPTKKGLGSYHFFIDIEMSMEDVLLQAAVAEIEALGFGVRQLGSYPCYAYRGHLKLSNR